MRKSTQRILWFLGAFLSVTLLPWWLSTFLLVFLLVYLENYYEVMFFGFLFDILYLSDLSFPYTGLTLATIFLVISVWVKSLIRT